MDNSTFLVFISALNRYFDTIQYNDDIYDHETRVATLRHVYAETAKYFDQPEQKAAIEAQPARFKSIMRTSSQVVVYCWPKCSLDVMVAVSVYFVHIVLLDDSTNNPSPLMLTFGNDLIKGEPQKHPFWSLMNAHLSKFLSYYGGFCSLAILRSTFDYFQGCWVEQHNFHGYPGSEYFPGFLRRLNGLGGICGGSLFPRDDFDEDALFPQIATAIAELEIPVAFINDLMSFYKEYGNPRDEVNLVSNWCTTEGLSISESFERLTNETCRGSKRVMDVLDGLNDKDPKISETIHAFIHGYVTWHFCDERFRFKEAYERCGDSPEELKFRQYYEKAMAIGTIDFKEWAVWPPANETENMGEMNGTTDGVINGAHDMEAEDLTNGVSHGLGNGELLNLYATPMVAK
ncbi:hypothetical protein Neosp_013669 [[Neocosmospora] mangrovei]